MIFFHCRSGSRRILIMAGRPKRGKAEGDGLDDPKEKDNDIIPATGGLSLSAVDLCKKLRSEDVEERRGIRKNQIKHCSVPSVILYLLSKSCELIMQ